MLLATQSLPFYKRGLSSWTATPSHTEGPAYHHTSVSPLGLYNLGLPQFCCLSTTLSFSTWNRPNGLLVKLLSGVIATCKLRYGR